MGNKKFGPNKFFVDHFHIQKSEFQTLRFWKNFNFQKKLNPKKIVSRKNFGSKKVWTQKIFGDSVFQLSNLKSIKT